MPTASPASLSNLSLNLEQGFLRTPEATGSSQTSDLKSQGLASVVGEQISNRGGSLHSLSAFGAK